MRVICDIIKRIHTLKYYGWFKYTARLDQKMVVLVRSGLLFCVNMNDEGPFVSLSLSKNGGKNICCKRMGLTGKRY